MDIQINAAQGSGKSRIASKIGALFGGIYRETVATVSGPIFNQSALRYAVIESRADVIVIDECQTWFMRQAKEAVQAARHQLHRDIVAIYLVQDHTIGVKSSTPVSVCGREMTPEEIVETTTTPLVWVHDEAINPTPEQIDSITTAFTDSANTFSQPESAPTSRACMPRTKKILLDLVRYIRANGGEQDVNTIDEIYAHYGASSLEDLAPAHYPEVHAKLMMLRDRSECRVLAVALAKASKSIDARGVLEKYGYTRVSEIQLADAAAVLVDLKIAQGDAQ